MWYSALWHLLGVLTEVGPAGLLAGTAAAAGLLLVAALAVRVLRRGIIVTPGPRITAPPPATGVPRHRDPDASGRPRPRAPTAARAAARAPFWYRPLVRGRTRLFPARCRRLPRGLRVHSAARRRRVRRLSVRRPPRRRPVAGRRHRAVYRPPALPAPPADPGRRARRTRPGR